MAFIHSLFSRILPWGLSCSVLGSDCSSKRRRLFDSALPGHSLHYDEGESIGSQDTEPEDEEFEPENGGTEGETTESDLASDDNTDSETEGTSTCAPESQGTDADVPNPSTLLQEPFDVPQPVSFWNKSAAPDENLLQERIKKACSIPPQPSKQNGKYKL